MSTAPISADAFDPDIAASRGGDGPSLESIFGDNAPKPIVPNVPGLETLVSQEATGQVPQPTLFSETASTQAEQQPQVQEEDLWNVLDEFGQGDLKYRHNGDPREAIRALSNARYAMSKKYEAAEQARQENAALHAEVRALKEAIARLQPSQPQEPVQQQSPGLEDVDFDPAWLHAVTRDPETQQLQGDPAIVAKVKSALDAYNPRALQIALKPGKTLAPLIRQIAQEEARRAAEEAASKKIAVESEKAQAQDFINANSGWMFNNGNPEFGTTPLGGVFANQYQMLAGSGMPQSQAIQIAMQATQLANQNYQLQNQLAQMQVQAQQPQQRTIPNQQAIAYQPLAAQGNRPSQDHEIDYSQGLYHALTQAAATTPLGQSLGRR